FIPLPSLKLALNPGLEKFIAPGSISRLFPLSVEKYLLFTSEKLSQLLPFFLIQPMTIGSSLLSL
ncbi:hypothetical protein, partial [Clostridium sp.]|uniref:hypothetical protein n=1 Tax=Clostridium sp. TaxID=1506 RepID=UPI00290265FD